MSNATEFLFQNRLIKPYWPSIPSHCITDEQITRWLFTQDIPYIEIDLEIDIPNWQHEAELAKDYFVPHREEQDHKGWNSCCIHGTSVNETGIWFKYYKEEQPYRWTEISTLTPSIKQFWENLPFEKYARIRFMELEPGGYIDPHSDSPGNIDILGHIIPFNIAIDHPTACYMTIENKGIVPWKTGNIKLINITKYHSVVNFSDKKRIHLIGHGMIGNRLNDFCKLIARSYKKQYERVSIKQF